MKRNVGMLDRVIRIGLGVLILAMVFTGPQSLWGFVGLIPFLTGVLGWCPIYTAINVDTTTQDQLRH